ncbi:hypothetical protein ACVWXN_002463 [Bradyrhizobium sp. i1.4.4]
MLGGCASVTRGTTENISISSTPSGVEAVVSGMEVPTTCTTPCSVVVKRNADISITFQKEGYEPQIVPLSRDIPTFPGPPASPEIFCSAVSSAWASMLPPGRQPITSQTLSSRPCSRQLLPARGHPRRRSRGRRRRLRLTPAPSASQRPRKQKGRLFSRPFHFISLAIKP